MSYCLIQGVFKYDTTRGLKKEVVDSKPPMQPEQY